VIEDELAIQDIIYDILTARDFTVLMASDGQMGIELAQQKLPDLILCDVGLPIMDGYTVLQTLRQDKTTGAIPFIFLTAYSSVDDLRQGMESGADDYLAKPFSATALFRAIDARLHKKNQIKEFYEESLEQLRRNITLALPHEFRTPLVGILGASEFLLSDFESLEPELVRELLQDIHRSGDRLHQLIQKYLCFVRLQDRHVRQTPLPQEIGDGADIIITETAQRLLNKCERLQDLQLNLTSTSLVLNGVDCCKLIEELLDNAAKFSEPGTPIILAVSHQNGYDQISVQDRGRGMTQLELGSIGALQQFQRDQYEQQGTGLGLAIAQLIASIYGGKLIIDSQIDQGTTVNVSLPHPAVKIPTISVPTG
jgi:signal transduction histidine kinase